MNQSSLLQPLQVRQVLVLPVIEQDGVERSGQ
jgi:hypothetical protein